MNSVSNLLTTHIMTLFTSATGVNATLNQMVQDSSSPRVDPVRTFAIQNAASELAERTLQGKYPAVMVYCDKLSNTLKEKFRAFSGTARACVEVRCSQDRLEGLDGKLQVYVDAVCRILEQSRGDWNNGLHYASGYEVSYGSVRMGGNHFLQMAKILFEVEVSR